MKKHSYKLRFFALIFLMPLFSLGQDSTVAKKHTPIKTISDIPHATLWQKWMWPHRVFAFETTKERVVHYDSAYIKSNYKRLVITLPISTRYLRFTLYDLKSGNKLVFAPNMQYDLGISISSRWASFILNTGLKLFYKDAETKGKTSFQDYQLNLYGRKVTTDMFVQYYSGFFIRNSKDYSNYISTDPFAIREDVHSFHMGVNSNYIVNNKRFSYGGSFAFVEQQKKSAGSMLIGLYYSYFDAQGSPSLISAPFRSSFDSLSLITKGHTHNFGLNIGYIYTLVFLKKFYATASAVQGVGGEQIFYTRENQTTYSSFIGGAGKLNARLAIRYDNGRSFIGAMAMTDYILFNAKNNSAFDYSYGKIMLYLGYRFSILKNEKKILRKLQLIDY